MTPEQTAAQLRILRRLLDQTPPRPPDLRDEAAIEWEALMEARAEERAFERRHGRVSGREADMAADRYHEQIRGDA